MHHIALNGSGPDDGHLNHKVIKLAGLQARQHADLRTAFDLEHPKGVALAQHVVHGRIFKRNVLQTIARPTCAMNQVKRLADAGEHAKRQDIDLHQAKLVDVFLVPFDEGAIVHRRIANGHKLVETVAGQHEAANML